MGLSVPIIGDKDKNNQKKNSCANSNRADEEKKDHWRKIINSGFDKWCSDFFFKLIYWCDIDQHEHTGFRSDSLIE